MATERLSMRHTREILRQKWALGRSHREVARSLGIGNGTVGTTVLRARAAGLDWLQVQGLADDALEARLYGQPEGAGTRQRPQPDCAYLHAERRKPGVTLELLHLEYLEQHPDGYRYTRFCELYRCWLQRRGLSMRQVHRAGGKVDPTRLTQIGRALQGLGIEHDDVVPAHGALLLVGEDLLQVHPMESGTNALAGSARGQGEGRVL